MIFVSLAGSHALEDYVCTRPCRSVDGGTAHHTNHHDIYLRRVRSRQSRVHVINAVLIDCNQCRNL